jgi:hypothetical protein
MNLLSLDDIAAMYRVSRRYARDFLTKKPEFPKPAPGSTKKKPLWTEDAIRSFLSPESRTNR